MKLTKLEIVAVHTAVLGAVLTNPHLCGSYSNNMANGLPDKVLDLVEDTANKYIKRLESSLQQDSESVNDKNGH